MKISKTTMTMLVLLSLCLLSDICASDNGTINPKSEQGFLVFEKASGSGGGSSSRGGGNLGGSRGGSSFGGSRGGSTGSSRGGSSSSSGSRGKSGGGTSGGRSRGGGNSKSPWRKTPAGAYNYSHHNHGSGCVHKAVNIHSLASTILGLSVLLSLA